MRINHSAVQGVKESRRIGAAVLLILLLAGCVTGRSVSREKEARAHYQMGISYLNENALQRAFVEFQKALELEPKNKDYNYALGHVYFDQGRYKEAEDSFRRVIKLDPSYSEAHNYLGYVLQTEGKTDAALAEYQVALKNPLYETPQKPHYHIGTIYLARGQYVDATKEFQEAIRLDSACIELCIPAYNDLGKTYFQMGKLEEAVSAYQEAIKASPTYLEAHYNLALAYMKTGAKGQAAGEFRKVTELAPDSGEARESRKYLEALK